MFGMNLKIGLLDSKLPKKLIEGINTEEEIFDIAKDTSTDNTLD